MVSYWKTEVDRLKKRKFIAARSVLSQLLLVECLLQSYLCCVCNTVVYFAAVGYVCIGLESSGRDPEDDKVQMEKVATEQRNVRC